MNPRSLSFGSERGQASVLVALNLTVLFGALGFAVDLGMGEYKKHAAQTAADAAAMGAAAYAAANGSACGSGITCNVLTDCTIPVTVSTPFGAGCVYAKANGYTNGGAGGQTVTIKANNTSSPVSGNSPNLWFQVTAGESYPVLFGRFGGVNTFTIHASSVAGLTSNPNGSCIVALSKTGVAFSDSGSGNITTNSCGIYDNAGFSYTGSGNITTLATQYAGSYNKTGSGRLNPTPVSTTAFVTDPFINLPSPPVSTTCTTQPNSYSDASAHTLSPGVFCGGLSISGSGNISFQPGIYIINGTLGSGKSFSYSGSGNLSGTNVMFFITGQNGYSAGPMSISGSGNLTFSAPSSGSYKGVLFYEDRNASNALANTFTGSGNITGTFYFPSTSLSYSGSGNAAYEAIVANKITMSGSGNFSQDVTGQYTGLLQSTASLIQ
ncbi:MAG TPA: pilus assembly protein TadG-related protein [Bryobacteraceae bacterium]|nr:pilus assembly protein TadG-related protein [Bryobacteraceae bacterium]